MLNQLKHYSQSFKTTMNLIWFLSKLDNKNPWKKPCCYVSDNQIARKSWDLSDDENDRKNCPIFKIFEELSEEGIQRFQFNFHQNQRIFTMVLRWLILSLILDMTFEQKWSSHVQTAVASKPFELKIPDTTQMKDLSKSFLTITNFP